jgi:hypothetical protein
MTVMNTAQQLASRPSWAWRGVGDASMGTDLNPMIGAVGRNVQYRYNGEINIIWL